MRNENNRFWICVLVAIPFCVLYVLLHLIEFNQDDLFVYNICHHMIKHSCMYHLARSSRCKSCRAKELRTGKKIPE
ncbi:hypothetical protein HanPI659440_Chr11g0425071 [Helianthus annuus]|nr:hypothetical protein HanPI659440_Chr11g0425071 [Helianthus annuus]